MAGPTPWYASRELVLDALDADEQRMSDSAIDRALGDATDTITQGLHRTFYPQVATLYFDWPNTQYARSWRLWLEDNELISITSVTTGGETLDPGDVLGWPYDGPPFKALDIDLSSSAGWSSAVGGGHQRSIAVTGVFGYRDDEVPAGALDEALDASETTVDVSDGSVIGVGDLIRCELERMVVTGRSWLDSGQNTTAALDADVADDMVGVSNGAEYHAGESILIGSERMLILDVAGNNLIVRRAYRGATLAAHLTAQDVYASRTLLVARGALGTTAATHADTTALVRWVPPAKVVTFAVAEAMVTFEQEKSAYARTVGAGENEQESRGAALAKAREAAYWAFGRTARTTAI